MSKTIAIANQKGGVGKTTTAVNLAACIAEQGYRTLLLDLDPQGNATSSYGIDRGNASVSTYEVLTGASTLEEARRNTSVPNLSIVPAVQDLAGAEVELVSAIARETKLRSALQAVHQDYDFILIDCPPSLGLLTLNAMCAANSVIAPIQCEYYALEGLTHLMQTIRLVRRQLNPRLEIEGIVMTMFDARTNLSASVIAEVQQYFKNKVYQTVIPRNIRLGEAPSFGKPITEYDPKSSGAAAYRTLAQEVLDANRASLSRDNLADQAESEGTNVSIG